MRWPMLSGHGSYKTPYINLESHHHGDHRGGSGGRVESRSPALLRAIQLLWLFASPVLVLGLYWWGSHRYKLPVIVPLEYRQDAYVCKSRPLRESIQSICSNTHSSKMPGSDMDMSMNRILTDDQCEVAFPGLYLEADRARDHWQAKGGVGLKELEDAIPKSQARVQIYNNRLYVLWYSDNQQGTRTKATLASIFEAVASSPEPIPDIEFVIQTGDNGIVEGAPWALGRRVTEMDLTLMPDYGFWSWPEPGVGSFLEVADKTLLYESQIEWSEKIPKLFWRGALMVEVRKRLVLLARKYRWGAVSDLDWGNRNDLNNHLLTPEEHCQYKYLAHIEGWAYSGRLKYLQQCRSVIVAHDMEYVQHFHPLFNPDDGSPDQNMVIIPGMEWETLPREMNRLLANDTRALEIATTSFNMWRKYLNPAATNCYWRRLFRRWAEVQRFEPQLYKDTVSYESFMLVGATKWEPH